MQNKILSESFVGSRDESWSAVTRKVLSFFNPLPWKVLFFIHTVIGITEAKLNDKKR